MPQPPRLPANRKISPGNPPGVAVRLERMRRTHTLGLVAAAVVGLSAAGAGVVATAATQAAPDICPAAVAPIYQVANPDTGASLVTASRTEADNARAYGFTVDNGAVFQAPTAAAAGLTPVTRLYHPTSKDFFWTADSAEAANAVTRHGYLSQQTDFYASTAALSCAIPVTRLVKGAMHRLAVGSAVTALTAQGWTTEGVKFHAFGPAGTVPLASAPPGGPLGAATFTVDDFGVVKDGRTVGAVLPASGLTGAGAGATTVQMTPNTSTKAALVPPNDPAYTNPLDLLMVAGTAGSPAAPTLRGFTLRGTPQGHLYNGLRMSHTRGARVSDVRVVAVPGDYHINPGETFGINDWQGHGNTYTGVEVDGAGVGASGLGINSSSNVTVTSADLHHNPHSAGLAAWQTTTVTLVDVRSAHNRTGLNFERVAGAVVITRPTLVGNTEQDLYIGSDLGSATYTITDPVLAPGTKLRVRLPRNEMGSPNLQRRDDIRVLVNGADVTAAVVHWL